MFSLAVKTKILLCSLFTAYQRSRHKSWRGLNFPPSIFSSFSWNPIVEFRKASHFQVMSVQHSPQLKIAYSSIYLALEFGKNFTLLFRSKPNKSFHLILPTRNHDKFHGKAVILINDISTNPTVLFVGHRYIYAGPSFIATNGLLISLAPVSIFLFVA